jgi:hypothetical protein
VARINSPIPSPVLINFVGDTAARRGPLQNTSRDGAAFSAVGPRERPARAQCMVRARYELTKAKVGFTAQQKN